MSETTSQSKSPSVADPNFQEAVKSVESTLAKLRGCSDSEREQLQKELSGLTEMYDKVSNGRIEIVIFGEISTGKSAMINALIGRDVASVDIQGGWTKEIWGTEWEGSGYRIPGFESSEIIVVDTPGINEVGGQGRAEMAEMTARSADLILFVTDSDLNETEYAALVELAAVQKPMILVFNKCDLYSDDDLAKVTELLKGRLAGLIPREHFVRTAADPREIEYLIEDEDGNEKSEWRKPDPDVGQLKELILTTLEKEGLGLIALNAAMYAADKSDKIASMRVEMRNKRADQIIWSMAATKAVAVAANPIPLVDVFSGYAIDAVMLVMLSKVYGIEFNMNQAQGLVRTLAFAGGIYALGEIANYGSSLFKGLTFGLGTVLTMIPQGAAAGFTSYVVGQAAKRYFEQGGSWGSDSPKSVVQDILDSTDRDSVVDHLKDSIRDKLNLNRHAEDESKKGWFGW